MTRSFVCLHAALCAVILLPGTTAHAQVVTERGFVEAKGAGFFEAAPNDPERAVADVLAREEVFVRPAPWFQVGAGVDFRANSHQQVEDEWRLDWEDRAILRPRLALRRLAATFTAGGFTVDLGKQFVRWGRADVIYPTDRFAPRDYLNVLDPDVLPVIAARPSLQIGTETIEAVVTLQPTPSRLPLFDQRWTRLPAPVRGLPIVDNGLRVDERPQSGARWRHTGSRLETAVSVFDGANHLPNIESAVRPDGSLELTRVLPRIRMVGGDVAVPTGWLTWKGEVAYVTSLDAETEEYVLYVVEIERQAGEWLLDVGYAGDRTTTAHPVPVFNPDRGMARSVIGRAAYTVDPRRSVVLEGAVRHDGSGVFARAEYSQSFGQHLRLTLYGVGIAGDEDDFIGQYRDNSHAAATVRVSF